MRSYFGVFSAVVLVLMTALLAVGIKAFRRQKRARDSNWEELMRRLVPVDRSAIKTVALYRAHPPVETASAPPAKELGKKDIWNLIGGMEGIRHIENNSEVLIDMALYLQHWYPDAGEIAEELRLEANRLKWHVKRLREAEKNACLEAHFHLYGRQAAESYYLMVQKTIELYRHAQATLLGDLQAAI